MKTPLAARAAALFVALAAAAAPMAASAAPQNRPQPQQQQHRDNDRHDNDRNNNDRYGRWDNSWGARPSAPPRSFTRVADWHRHVRACQQRYRSYNPSTDRYTVRRGQTAVCRL